MKKQLLVIVILFATSIGYSQNLTKILIDGRGQTEAFIFSLPGNVELYLTKDGQINKWGFDKYIGYQENYNNQLEPYVGRVEYYSDNDDISLRGKIKYIGSVMLNYYASYENSMLKGKLKSIGSVVVEYYLTFDDEAYRGFIKKIGNNSISWYSAFENEDIKGKLKGVGSTALTYYSSFEDKAFKGKIKSIDRNNFTYYSSLEQYSGSMKMGNSVINVSTIKYYIKNY